MLLLAVRITFGNLFTSPCISPFHKSRLIIQNKMEMKSNQIVVVFHLPFNQEQVSKCLKKKSLTYIKLILHDTVNSNLKRMGPHTKGMGSTIGLNPGNFWRRGSSFSPSSFQGQLYKVSDIIGFNS